MIDEPASLASGKPSSASYRRHQVTLPTIWRSFKMNLIYIESEVDRPNHNIQFRQEPFFVYHGDCELPVPSAGENPKVN